MRSAGTEEADRTTRRGPPGCPIRRTARGSAYTSSGSEIAESSQRSTTPAVYGVNLLSRTLPFLLCIVGC